MKTLVNFIGGLMSENSPFSSKRAIAMYLTFFFSALTAWMVYYSLVHNISLDHFVVTLLVVAILLTIWVMTGAATAKDILLGLQTLKTGNLTSKREDVAEGKEGVASETQVL